MEEYKLSGRVNKTTGRISFNLKTWLKMLDDETIVEILEDNPAVEELAHRQIEWMLGQKQSYADDIINPVVNKLRVDLMTDEEFVSDMAATLARNLVYRINQLQETVEMAKDAYSKLASRYEDATGEYTPKKFDLPRISHGYDGDLEEVVHNILTDNLLVQASDTKDICPYCGAYGADLHDSEWGDGTFKEIVACNSCGAEYRQTYYLVEQEKIKEKV